MSAYADVALPVPLDRAFTYLIPAGWQVAPGVRVTAPWGRRSLTGVVTALRDALPAGLDSADVKPLGAVLGAEPALDPIMLELVSWAAAYYQAPLGEMMRCALAPTAAPPSGRRMIRLPESEIGPDVEAKLETPRLSAAQRRVLDHLRAAGGVAGATELRAISPAALATLLRHGRVVAFEAAHDVVPPSWQPRPRVARLNPGQQVALDAIRDALPAEVPAAAPRPLLLHGVTGSGKTAVYLEAIAAALERGHGALLLVPEIGLTPALFADFEDAFPALVAVLHSGLGPADRARHWRRLQSGDARLAIGTRSAVFAPVERLGLIIVDEEHDASFKQQETPRYHGRDLALVRGKLCRAAVVLGSATPSLESYTHACGGKYRLLELSERVESRPLPAVRVLAMSEEFRRQSAAAGARNAGDASPARETLFAAELLDALRARLERREQSLLLINRRGFAPVVLCRACGNAAGCRDCSLSLTYHKRAGKLVCHLCGFATPVPETCATCGGTQLYFLGAGSEKIEEELGRVLPSARLARLDRDTATSRKHFERVLAQFRRGELDILIGTQMIAKGHDLPGVTLVGVLQADLGLTFPDFRAAERTFQLLTQVAGRAGRGDRPGEVLFQTLHPEHYAVVSASRCDFAGFYEKEANFRRWMHYPPFASLALVQVRHKSYDNVLAFTTALGRHIAREGNEAVRVLGPVPAVVARVKTEYRFQWVLKSPARRALHALLASVRRFAAAERWPATALIVDVDPLSL